MSLIRTTPYTWSIAQGALPPGITLDADGTLHGTATSSGAFSFRAQVSDVSAPSMQATVDLDLRVFAPLAIAAITLPGGLLSTAYSAALTTTGGAPPYAFTIASAVCRQGSASTPVPARSPAPRRRPVSSASKYRPPTPRAQSIARP